MIISAEILQYGGYGLSGLTFLILILRLIHKEARWRRIKRTLPLTHREAKRVRRFIDREKTKAAKRQRLIAMAEIRLSKHNEGVPNQPV